MTLEVKNINEALTEILAKAIKETTTPALILKELLSRKNVVQEYFSDNDLHRILLDLEKAHQETANEETEIKTFQALNKFSDMAQDRFATELTFMLFALQEEPFKRTIKSVITKYISFDHLIEDLKMMAPAVPNMFWEFREQTILDTVGRNLTDLAMKEELPTIVDRGEELQRLISILTRQTKSNPVLIGKAGVGKTAIVEKLADILYKKEDLPLSLVNYKLVEINMASLLSMGAGPGEMEELIEKIISAAKKDDVILFMDEVHLIMEEHGRIANLLKPAMARGDIKLIGATTQDEFKVFEKDEAIMRRFQPIQIEEPNKVSVYRILKTKADEAEKFHRVLIPDETLLRAITLSERYIPDRQQPDKAIDLIEEASAKLRMALEGKPQQIIEAESKVADLEIDLEILEIKSSSALTEREEKKKATLAEQIKDAKIELDELKDKYETQAELMQRLLRQKEKLSALQKEFQETLHLGLFHKAIKLEEEVIPQQETAIAETEQDLLDFAATADENLIQNVVQPRMIETVIEIKTGIPVSAQGEDDLAKYRDIEEKLKAQVHGQEKPIHLLSQAIQRAKAGLSDANKPLGSFLCLGPTGVGKTYLAQKLAGFMFDTEKVLKRFDMSEYMEAHSVARLFGSPPGYVGHDEGGQLTELIKRNPYSIILFDEIEKAHKRVFDALLQILDAGRMTDGKGAVINFKNTIIIMTSNVGSDIIRSGLEQGVDSETIEESLFTELNNHFRPEFLNRFDAKLVFNSLSEESVVKIAESELHKLAESLSENNDLDLYWHSNVPVSIVNVAYSLTDGARPIKRFINDQIISLLTEQIMSGEIQPGNTIYLAADKDGFAVFKVDAEELKALIELDNSKKKKTKLNKSKKRKSSKKAIAKKEQNQKIDDKGNFHLDIELGE
jgi:ATP-dependent Clp protease ATP-binding subunit ClpB